MPVSYNYSPALPKTGLAWFFAYVIILTYLGINENPIDTHLPPIKVMKDNSADWKISYAGNWHVELDLLLDDYCFFYGEETNVQRVKERTKRGQTTIKQLDKHLEKFIIKKNFETKQIITDMEKGKQIISELSENLPLKI